MLFCDLVSFTSLSEARDPEEVRELLSRYFDTARTVIGRHGGVVEKFIGDAVMAVWGTPTATEQDAERALRAALGLVEAVDELGRESGIEGLQARAGVVTGAVAVTIGATGEGMVAGDAVNTAARVQAAAEPGAVLVDEGTWRVARAAIDFELTGRHQLKGKAEPVLLWRAGRVISGVGGAQRIDGLEAGFVGRDAELRLVRELFHACVQRRSPRLVSVTGPAGVGKSRLGWEFEKYIDGLADTVWWHRGRCLSYGDGVAFWALAEMVRQRLQIAEGDSTAVAAEKLASGLEHLLDDPGEREYVGPRLAQLLGTEGSGETQLQKEELFAGWRLFFERLGATAPVVLLVEDLQHADVGLLDFLEHLLDWARGVPIFVLTLARPELDARRAGWGTGRRNSTALTLDALDEEALDELLEGLVPGMPRTAKSAVAERAEGIPLYAVETVRMLIDREIVQPVEGLYRLVGDVGELAVPATLQSLLAARLDALQPDARQLVAAAAVLGSSFPAEALVAVSDQPESDVRRLLDELVRREVLGVRADPLSPQRGHYGFVQTMFRQVAYDTLSRRERKARHLAVAKHLRSAFADGGEEIAEVIAAHLLDALNAVPGDPGDPDVVDLRVQTVAMLTRAGERAERTGAPAAAGATYTTAASLLDDTGTTDSELAAASLRERAGATASSVADFPTSLEHYRKAAEVYRRLGHDRLAARAETQVGAVLRRAGRLEEARKEIIGALAVLEAEPDADTVNARAELATLHAFSGDALEAERMLTAAFAEAQALDLSGTVITELFVIHGIAHGLANHPIQAAADLREAVRRAESAKDSAAAVRALLNLGDTLLTLDPEAAVEATQAALAHGRRIGYRYLMATATSNLLQALLMTGDWSAAQRVYISALEDDELGGDGLFANSAAILLAMSGAPVTLPALESAGNAEPASDEPQEIAALASALGAAALSSGEYADALAHAHRALDQAHAVSLRSDTTRWAWAIAADAALALGDHAEVDRLLDWLDTHPRGHIPPVLRAERQRIDARRQANRGDPGSGQAFDAATQAFRELGSPYHLAVGLLDHAEHLAATGDAAAAEPLAVKARSIAEGLGAKPLLTRARRLTPAADVEPLRERVDAAPGL